MNEWNIQSRAHACEVCGQAFADKQAYHTVLFDEPPLLRRSDICEACAKKVNDQRGRAGEEGEQSRRQNEYSHLIRLSKLLREALFSVERPATTRIDFSTRP